MKRRRSIERNDAALAAVSPRSQDDMIKPETKDEDNVKRDKDLEENGAAIDPSANPAKCRADDTALMLTQEQLLSCRSALRDRIRHDLGNAIHTTGLERYVTDVEELLERTVARGENQSGLLVGRMGSAKKQVVIQALHRLRTRVRPFTHVYLNGIILQNEVEAFKEIIAQLTQDKSVKHAAVQYFKMYEYLKELLRQKAYADEPVVIIVDRIERFASERSPKQLLLYNLLDWLQSTDVKLAILGMTHDYIALDHMEKRVRSRFSGLQIIMDAPRFPQVLLRMQQALELATVDWARLPFAVQPSDRFVEMFDTSTRELFVNESVLRAMLEFDYDQARPPEFFAQVALAAVYNLTMEEPLLTLEHFKKAKRLLEQDHQLAILNTVNDHGIALLIGMSHLERDGHTFFTMEMVYHKWEQFYLKHDILSQMPTRSEVQKALENLLRLQLVKDAGDAFKIGRAKYATPDSLQPEYRALVLNMEPRTLYGMIRNGSIQCSTTMKQWALNRV